MLFDLIVNITGPLLSITIFTYSLITLLGV